MTRAERIEETVRGILDRRAACDHACQHSECRIVRELRAALSLPPDAPDEYRRGIEDAARVVEGCGGGCEYVPEETVETYYARAIRALAPPPAPAADEVRP